MIVHVYTLNLFNTVLKNFVTKALENYIIHLIFWL
jgi:hypothetical protein